jgi:hypothetical protein
MHGTVGSPHAPCIRARVDRILARQSSIQQTLGLRVRVDRARNGRARRPIGDDCPQRLVGARFPPENVRNDARCVRSSCGTNPGDRFALTGSEPANHATGFTLRPNGIDDCDRVLVDNHRGVRGVVFDRWRRRSTAGRKIPGAPGSDRRDSALSGARLI